MKLLQLNTWQLRLDKKVTELVKTVSPDVICFQEVCDSKDDLGFITTLTELVEGIDYPSQYYSPFYNFTMMHGKAGFGNAILAKTSLQETETVFTSKQYTDDFIMSDENYNVRNFQHAVVQHDGASIHVINYHGYHIAEHKNGNEHTLKACQQIADYVAGLKGPIVVAGDFNLTPLSESIEILNRQLVNLTSEYGLETTRNDLTSKVEACDYIFVNDQVKVNDFYMSDIIASDHQALVLDFSV